VGSYRRGITKFALQWESVVGSPHCWNVTKRLTSKTAVMRNPQQLHHFLLICQSVVQWGQNGHSDSIISAIKCCAKNHFTYFTFLFIF
jgi:hypothetical protein